MTQESAVVSWKTGALDAWDTFEALLAAKKYAHALFFLHLAFEKLLKAIVIHKTDTPPPPTHDLVRLAESAGLTLDEEKIQQLAEISTFNVAARYDEEKLQLHQKATPAYLQDWQHKGKELFEQLSAFL